MGYLDLQYLLQEPIHYEFEPIVDHIILHHKVGNEVSLIGPPSLVPSEFENMGAKVFHNIEEGVNDADVVMMLRVQSERGAGNYFPSIREYRKHFSLNKKVISKAKDTAIVMHPGPLNRDVEIDNTLADSNRSVILQQVTNGIAVRMAVLFLLKGDIDEPAN